MSSVLPPLTSATTSATPGLGPLAAASLLPSLLGLWRTGYAVSYGYGGALAACGVLQLFSLRGPSASISPSLRRFHAALYVLYGVRLCAFLLHRELTLPVEIHQMKRRDATLKERMGRLPVAVGCSLLYFCMTVAPMRALAATGASGPCISAALGVGAAGFLLAAVGDWYKARTKARDGPDKLVTSGPYRYFRHPNYTGEMLLWTCVCVVAPLLGVFGGGATGSRRAAIPWILSSVLGWAGMVFQVLMGEATKGLERKQREKYGGTPQYEKWIMRSWSGPMLGSIDD